MKKVFIISILAVLFLAACDDTNDTSNAGNLEVTLIGGESISTITDLDSVEVMLINLPDGTTSSYFSDIEFDEEPTRLWTSSMNGILQFADLEPGYYGISLSSSLDEYKFAAQVDSSDYVIVEVEAGDNSDSYEVGLAPSENVSLPDNAAYWTSDDYADFSVYVSEKAMVAQNPSHYLGVKRKFIAFFYCYYEACWTNVYSFRLIHDNELKDKYDSITITVKNERNGKTKSVKYAPKSKTGSSYKDYLTCTVDGYKVKISLSYNYFLDQLTINAFSHTDND